MPAPFTPDQWMHHVFSSKSAIGGGVVRRQRRDIERYVGLEYFHTEMQRRGFTVLENAGQYVIFCNQEPIRRII